jgi:4'-phosphopantetheinyl transferase
VEKITALKEMNSLVEHYFSTLEGRQFFQIPGEIRTEAFFRAWARKEAFLKAVGEGLYRPLNSFSVITGSGEWDCWVEDHGEGSPGGKWAIHDIPVDAGYAAAAVVEGDRLELDLKEN